MDGGSSDRELADRLAAAGGDDPQAFHALYVRHTPALYAIAVRLAVTETDAEDAVHDTWLRAAAGVKQFRWRSSLRTWLVGVLINRLRESRRAERPTVDVDECTLELPSPAATLPEEIDPIDLERAVAAMPMRYREVMLLHDLEGYTHDEIGHLLGIETGTSKSQLARGRRWLRQALLSTDGVSHDERIG